MEGKKVQYKKGLNCLEAAMPETEQTPCKGSVLVFIRNLPVMQLCRLHVEPCIVVRLCPVHCLLNFAFILKHESVFTSPQGVS